MSEPHQMTISEGLWEAAVEQVMMVGADRTYAEQVVSLVRDIIESSEIGGGLSGSGETSSREARGTPTRSTRQRSEDQP